MATGLAILLILFGLTVVNAGQTGNSLVNCAACQAVQPQIDHWSCDVNCKVINAQNDGLVTSGVVQDLIEKLNQMNETVQQQARIIEKLQGATCAFSARGPDTLTQTSFSGGVVSFATVDLNICNAYNPSTGIFTPTMNGTYLLSVHIRGALNNGDIYIKRNNDIVCRTWILDGSTYDPTTCTTVAQLSTGDSIRVTIGETEPARISGDYRHFSGHILHPN